jgi:hypothetical protein
MGKNPGTNTSFFDLSRSADEELTRRPITFDSQERIAIFTRLGAIRFRCSPEVIEVCTHNPIRNPIVPEFMYGWHLLVDEPIGPEDEGRCVRRMLGDDEIIFVLGRKIESEDRS